jgi:predicted nucleic acid-binding protein
VFLDTNVILDLFIEREPHHEIALRFFSYLERNASTVWSCTSPVVIANVSYLLGRAKSERYAVRKLAWLRRIVRVVPMSEDDVDHAIGSPGDDFTDSLQYHCARANAVSVIVTRNAADFPVAGVTIVSPEEFMTMDATDRTERPT